MLYRRSLVPVVLSVSLFLSAQTADELVNKNIAAKGGMDKIKAIRTVRITSTVIAGHGSSQ